MIKDLTVGRPGKVLLRYSLPLFGSIVFQQLYNIADSFVAGQYIGTDALAAVGNSYELTLLYIGFAFGCNIGTSVITALYFGMKEQRTMKTVVYTALLTSAVLGTILTVGGLLFAKPLLEMIQTPADLFADSLCYLNIYLLGFLFVLGYNIATGVFSALGDSQTPFFFLVGSSVSNVAVDILFVKNLHMGVAGVAWATFLCQGVSCVAAMTVMLRRLRRIPSEGKSQLFNWHLLGEIAHVAVPSILQQGFISVGNIAIQGLINSFGKAATGGYAAAVKLNNMTITSITALGNGMSNYAAQNAGAGKPERIRRGLKSGVLMGWGIALGFTALYLLGGSSLVGLFITDGNVAAAEIGVAFLQAVAPFYVVIGGKLVMDGVLRGTNKMGLFMVTTLTDLAIRVALSNLLAGRFGLGGIWESWPIGWVVAAVMSIFFCYWAGKKNYGLVPTEEPAVSQ